MFANPDRRDSGHAGTGCIDPIPPRRWHEFPNFPATDGSFLQTLLSQIGSKLFGGCEIDGVISAVHHDSVNLTRFFSGNASVFNIAQPPLGVTFQRIAVAAAAGPAHT